MNSAALFSPFFFDFDFLCFFLRCDPDRLFDLERPRDDEEDDDELEEEDVDLGKKRSRVSPNVKPCQHCSLKTCFFCTKFFSQDLLNCFPRFWILTLLPLPSSSSSSHLTSLSSFSNQDNHGIGPPWNLTRRKKSHADAAATCASGESASGKSSLRGVSCGQKSYIALPSYNSTSDGFIMRLAALRAEGTSPPSPSSPPHSPCCSSWSAMLAASASNKAFF